MPKPNAVTLVLLSSAATPWDESGRLIGRAALPATNGAIESLVAQLRAKPAPFPKLDLILCGPEESTHASAALLAEASGAKLRKLEELSSVNLGLWEGALRSELEGRCPTTYKAWREQPEAIRPPEGESIGDAADRATLAIRKACEKCKTLEPRVGVVVRPLLWAALLSRLGFEPWSNYWALADQTGEIRPVSLPIADLVPQPVPASA